MEYGFEPKLLFVTDGNKYKLFIDGEEVQGINNLVIKAPFNEFVKHEIEFITIASGKQK